MDASGRRMVRWQILLLVAFCSAIYPSCERICTPHCAQGGDIFTRLRALYVMPNDSSGWISTIPHAKIDVHSSWTADFDVGVMFNRTLGLELMLTTFRSTLMGTGSFSGRKIGTSWLFPPTLLLQLRLFSCSVVQVYAGGGANYTLFYNVDSSLSHTKLNLSHSWGPAVQGGIDLFFLPEWFFNFDIKYLWVDTHARLTGNTSGKVSIDVNPWLFGMGIGRKW